MAYSVALNWVGTIRPAASGANWATVGQFIDPKFRYSTVSSNGVLLRASSNSSNLLAPLVKSRKWSGAGATGDDR